MLKENWWVPNFVFIKISILKSLIFLMIPSLVRRHSELLGIEILLNTQTPENDNFTRKVFWVFEGLLKTKTLECDDFIWKHPMFLCIHVFLNTQDNFIWNHAGFLGIEVLLHTQNHEMWSILMRQHAGFRVLQNWNVLKKLDSHSMGSMVDVVWKCGGIILEICTHALTLNWKSSFLA